jgi:hypothetical protein
MELDKDTIVNFLKNQAAMTTPLKPSTSFPTRSPTKSTPISCHASVWTPNTSWANCPAVWAESSAESSATKSLEAPSHSS